MRGHVDPSRWEIIGPVVARGHAKIVEGFCRCKTFVGLGNRLIEKIFIAGAPRGFERNVAFFPSSHVHDTAASCSEKPVHVIESTVAAVEECTVVVSL